MSIDSTPASVSSLEEAELLKVLRDKEIQLRRLYALQLRLATELEARGIRDVRHSARGCTDPPPSGRFVQAAGTNDGRRDM